MKTTKLTKVASVGLTISMLSGLAACNGGAAQTSEITTLPSQIETSETESGRVIFAR